MHKRWMVLGILLVSLLCFGLSNVFAETTQCSQYDGTNKNQQNYISVERWATTVKSYLSVTADGQLMRFQADAISDQYLVEYYNTDYTLLKTVKVDKELPVFGAFFAGENYNYVLSGQENLEDSDDVEVVRVTQYDHDWNKLKELSITAINTYIPFDAGSARIDEQDGYLLIHTCHEMYAGSNGVHHQANMTFVIKQDTMTLIRQNTAVSYIGAGYVSHSFNQFIKTDGDNVVTVDHGDAYPRSVVLVKYQKSGTTPMASIVGYKDLLSISGSTEDNTTGVTVGGLEVGDNCYVVAGGSIDQVEGTSTRNIFVATIDKSLNTPVVNYITDYQDGEESPSTPQLVKCSDGTFILMWTWNGQMYVTKLDKNGQQKGAIETFDGNQSDCQPIVTNGKVLWYVWKDEKVTFYEINENDITDQKATVFEDPHDFEITIDGTTAHRVCRKCGYEDSVTVMNSLYIMYGLNTPYSFSTSVSTTISKGDILYYRFGPNNNVDVVIEVSDSAVARLDTEAKKIKAIKPGTFKVSAYVKYNPSIKTSKTFTVAGDYQAPTFEFSEDGKSAIATFVSEFDSSDVVEVDANVSSEIIKEATCLEKGTTRYTASASYMNASGSDTLALEDIDALGHDYGVPSFVFSKNGHNASATFVCQRNSEHQETIDAKVTSEIVRQPTCESKGKTAYTATAELDGVSGSDVYEVEDIDALGHKYSSGFIIFSDDGQSAEATFVCEHDKTHTVTISADVKAAETLKPTCEDKGTTTYIAAATYEGVTLTDQIEKADIDALGHDYAAPTFEFTRNGKSATATFVCQRDQSHVKTVDAVVTSKVKVEPTCETSGKTTYTATAELEGVSGTASIDIEDLPPLGHDYAEPVFSFSKNGHSAVAKFICKNDDSHVYEMQAKVTSSIKVPATCEAKGITTYTAYAEYAGVKGEDSMEREDIEALGHQYDHADFDFKDDGSCIVTFICSNDESHQVKVDADVESEVIKESGCETKGVTAYKATATYEEVTLTEKKELENIPALGHDWSQWQSKDDDQHVRVCSRCYQTELKDHQWDKGKQIVAPTALAEGDMEYTCTTCGDTKHEAIPMLVLTRYEEVLPTCTEDGHMTYYLSEDGRCYSDAEGTHEIELETTVIGYEAKGHNYSQWEDHGEDTHTRTCSECDDSETADHQYSEGVITQSPTTSRTGLMTYTCEDCGHVKEVTLAKLADNTPEDPETAPAVATTEQQVVAITGNSDPKGSKFNILQAKAKKIASTSITLGWTKVKGAKSYIIYGNICKKGNKYKKLYTINSGSTVSKKVTKIGANKLKKGTYYKFIVVAVGKDALGNDKAIATSKSIHLITTGHKTYSNFTKVKLTSKSKVTLKKGKTSKIKATQVKPKGKKVQVHRGLKYESNNKTVATVSSKGKITAKKKGKATIYVYAQNGLFTKVTVTVK